MNLHLHRHSLRQPLYDAAQSPARDPTGTTQLRLRFRADAQRRLSALRSATHSMLVERDALNHRATAGIDIFKLPHDPGHYVDEFMRWFEAAAYNQLVVSNWWIPQLERAFNSGIVAGAQLLQREQFMPLALPALYGTQVERELNGLVAALVQQVSRALAQGALRKIKVPVLYRQLLSTIRKVGVVRLNALANTQVVQLHNLGRLAIFHQMGVEQVGTVAERLPALTARDAQFADRTREELALEAAERRARELFERQQHAAEAAEAAAEVAAQRASEKIAKQIAAELAGAPLPSLSAAAAQAELKAAQAAAKAEIAGAKAATAARELEAKAAWKQVLTARRAERAALYPVLRPAETGRQLPAPEWVPPPGYERVAQATVGVPTIPERLLKIGSEFVNVLTAGDNRVCIICETLSENGPYSLAEAQGMLPAHIDCRCAFVPAFSRRNQELVAEVDHLGDEVCHEPAGQPTGGQFVSCGTGSLGGHDDGRLGVSWYAGSRNAMAMNQALRAGQVANLLRDHETGIVELTKEIAAEPPLVTDIRVYRGVDRNFAGKLKVGDEFIDKGFTSTSTDEGIARVTRSGEPITVMDVELIKGTPALTVKGSSEKEIIVQRGTRYRVVATRGEGGKRLRLRVIASQDFKKEKKPWTFDATESRKKLESGDPGRFIETGKGLKIEKATK